MDDAELVFDDSELDFGENELKFEDDSELKFEDGEVNFGEDKPLDFSGASGGELVPYDGKTIDAEFVPDMEPVFKMVDDELSKLSASELKSQILDVKNAIESKQWELCKYLWYINKKRSYTPHKTFNEYVEKELTFEKSKARYLVQIWERLYVAQSDKTVFHKVIALGWTKAKELIHVVTAENVDAWVGKAKHISVEQLRKEVKNYLNSIAPVDDPKKVVEQSEQVEGTPAEHAMKELKFSFQYHDFVAVSEALDRVKSNYSSQDGLSNGAALALICADYLATNPIEGQDGDSRKFLIDSMLKYEKLAGVEIIVLDTKAETVLCGSEHLEAVMKEFRLGEPEEEK